MLRKTDRFKALMEKVPHWVPTSVIAIIICWLTLAPRPLGEVEIPLFPGADKIIHGLMFGTLTFAFLFDICRHNGWRQVVLPLVSLVALGCGAFGIIIEFLQEWMGLGRGLEIYDMVADLTGAVAFGVIWLFVQPVLVKKKHDDGR